VHLERLQRVLVVGGHEDDDGRPAGTERLEDREPVQLRDLHVEEDEVGAELADRIHRLAAVAALADDLDVGLGLEEAAETIAGERLVVDDQGSDLHAASRTPWIPCRMDRFTMTYAGDGAGVPFRECALRTDP
jgi:hypothetical protein